MKLRVPGILGCAVLALAAYGALELISSPRMQGVRTAICDQWNAWMASKGEQNAQPVQPQWQPGPGFAPQRKPIPKDWYALVEKGNPAYHDTLALLQSGEVADSQEAIDLKRRIAELKSQLEANGGDSKTYKQLAWQIAVAEESLAAANLDTGRKLQQKAYGDITDNSRFGGSEKERRHECLHRFVTHLNLGMISQEKQWKDATYSKRWFESRLP